MTFVRIIHISIAMTSLGAALRSVVSRRAGRRSRRRLLMSFLVDMIDVGAPDAPNHALMHWADVHNHINDGRSGHLGSNSAEEAERSSDPI
jgi:hypothetical protein